MSTPDDGLIKQAPEARRVLLARHHPATSEEPHNSVSGTGAAAERGAAGVAYRALGWPITLCRDQITLNLDRDLDAVALVIPTLLATEVADVLVRRHCPPPVLTHPALPTHRISWPGSVSA